ncbi:MAG: ABC transporter ATP-binding protein [Actinomycetota bacterium]
MSTAAPLEIQALVTSFGSVIAVDGVDLTLGSNELLALVGPSGCGKSTLLRTIAGLVAADAGTIRLGGELVEDGSVRLPPERRPAGLVFQEHALFPHLSVRDNVGFGLRDMPRSEIDDRVAEMLSLIGLGEHGARYPHELSGGERQRVALARALAPRPALMLFDEPFASLDHNLRVQLRHDVVAALKATGTPAVFVTHDQREALTIGDRIAVMRAGRIVQIDSAPVVFHRPIDQFVASFMGEASFLPIVDVATRPHTALGPLDVDLDRTTTEHATMSAMIRPDDVQFTPTVSGEAEVISRHYFGSGWLVTVQLPDASTVMVVTSHLEPPEIGERGDLALVPGHSQVVVPRHRPEPDSPTS